METETSGEDKESGEGVSEVKVESSMEAETSEATEDEDGYF